SSTHLHPRHPFIPSRDDLPGTEAEPDRLGAVAAAVELLPVQQPSGVMDFDLVPGRRPRALAHRDVLITESRSGSCHCRSVDREIAALTGACSGAAFARAAGGEHRE